MFVSFNKPEAQPFDKAIEAHRAGRLPEAEQLYRQVLAQNPNHSEALHMLGLLAHQCGHSHVGVELMEKSMILAPTPAVCSNLAEVKRTLGRLQEAEELCRRAITMQPNLAAAHTNLAMVYQQAGRLQDALNAALKAVELGPNEVAGYNAAGVALLDLNRPMDAAKYIDAALRLNPNDPMIWTAAAFCCERLEQADKAMEHLKRAVTLAPEHPRVLLHMGGLLARLEKFADSEPYLEKAWQKEPNLPAALEQLAGVKMSLRKFEESIDLCRQYLAKFPQSPAVYPTMGEAMMGLGRFEECITEMNAALAKFPGDFAVLQTMSNAHVRDGRPEVGLEVLERALSAAPENPILHFNKSIILMLMGKLDLAWPEYEWRWQHPRMGWRNRSFGKPKWDGSPLNGKRILLHAEQGMGDTIFFGRYITKVAERGGVPVVFAQTSMVELVKTIKGTAEVIGEGVQIPPFDVHMPLMSLPGVFDIRLDNVPAEVPYIKANPEKSAYWKDELTKRANGKLKVGLVWEGGPFQPENFLRSASLAAYAPLGEVPGVAFFGLQKGAAEVQAKTPPAGMDFTDLAPFIKDFSDTAAMIDALDLLISIDTSVVHVAGALAKPVWMLLAYSPGHMWMLNRNDSPWYPTFRIWRQPKFKDWATPVGQIKAELEKFVAERRK